ncbi:DUF4350 domain-containing protein [Zobellia nedashkovskayae]|uniref:DUF4350 domain-containing protein n=1 Tax=Zobellia nedashkovskayae TaxID=2779510 RepID=UPI00188A1839|nr:DUF4350 domain-containing protein [Zobellia nedashkovskayae]
MDKKGLKYIIIAVATVALLMVMQYNRPKEINWTNSYVAKHKIPYGTFVLNDVMQNLFKDKIQQVNIPPFEFLKENEDISGTYFFVNNNVSFGDTELASLLDWVDKGNTLFIASENYEEQLLDTLKINTASLFSGLDNIRSHKHRLVNPQLASKDGYFFNKEDYVTYFQEFKTDAMTILGTVTNINNDNTDIKKEQVNNVVKTSFGKGEIILSTFPKAFTNYFILKDNNKQYTAGILSYLDDSRAIYMDNHYKSGKSVYTSPMYVFLNTKEFKWAYYLTLIGVVIYVFFEGKRKQRAIPVINPLKNQTLAFTRTIADMYFEKGERKQITEHKIAHFLEFVRSRFYMSTLNRDDAFYTNLAMRSNHSKEETKALFSLIEQLEAKDNLTDIELQKLNSAIENFKKKSHGK